MKKTIIILMAAFLALAGQQKAHAQRWKLLRYELSGGIGASYYFGDIGSYSNRNLSNFFGLGDVQLLAARPTIFLGFRYRAMDNVSIKTNLIFGYLYGNDKWGQFEERGLAFSTRILEPSVQVNYFLIPEKFVASQRFIRGGVRSLRDKLSLYLFAGIGAVYYEGKGKENLSPGYSKGNYLYYYDEQGPLGLAVPFGGGLKFSLTRRIGASLELGMRYTNRHDIDLTHVRQIENATEISKATDMYMIGNISLTYKLKTNRKGFPTFR